MSKKLFKKLNEQIAINKIRKETKEEIMKEDVRKEVETEVVFKEANNQRLKDLNIEK